MLGITVSFANIWVDEGLTKPKCVIGCCEYSRWERIKLRLLGCVPIYLTAGCDNGLSPINVSLNTYIVQLTAWTCESQGTKNCTVWKFIINPYTSLF